MEVITEVCRYCHRDIPDYSILTHEAHCERGHRLKNGQLLSPEPRSPSPVVEEPSECSIVSSPGDVEVTTVALDQVPSWPNEEPIKQNITKSKPDSGVTYIPIQLPNNGKFDSYLYNLDNGQGSQCINASADRTLTNSPVLFEDDGKSKFDFTKKSDLKYDYNIDNIDKPKHKKNDLSTSATVSPKYEPSYGVKNSWLYPAQNKKACDVIPESVLDTSSNKSGSSMFDPGTPKNKQKDQFVNNYIWENIPETVLNFKSEKNAQNNLPKSSSSTDENLPVSSPSNLSSLKSLIDDIDSLPDLESIKSSTSDKVVKSPEDSISSLNFGRLKNQNKEEDSESVKSGATTSTLKLGENVIHTPINLNRLKSKDEKTDFEVDSLKSGASTPSTVFDLSLNSPEEINFDRNSKKGSPIFNKNLESPELSKDFEFKNDNKSDDKKTGGAFNFYPDLENFGQTRISPGKQMNDLQFQSSSNQGGTLKKEPEKAPGVTCPDCHRIQKAGGLRHHLEQECQFRTKPCSFCETPYRARDLECHMVVCGTRTEKCPDCDEMIMIKYKHIHLESNHGFIKLDDEPDNLFTWTPLPRLPLRPPDLIKNIPLSTKDDDSRAEIPCEFCEEIFPAYRLTVHQLGCRLKQQTNEKTNQKQGPSEPSSSFTEKSSSTTPISNKTTYDYPVHLSPPIVPSRKNKSKLVSQPSTSTQPKTVYHHIPTIVDALPKYSPGAPSTSRVTPIVHHIPTVIQPAPRIDATVNDARPKTRYTTSVHHVPTVVQTRPKVHHIPTVLEGSPRYHYIPISTSPETSNGFRESSKEHIIPIKQESKSTNPKKATKSNSAPLSPKPPGIDVISFGNVLEVSDKFKNDWKNLEQRMKDNSKDDLHVIPCEYCSKMLRIGEVMSHQMLCFLQQ